VNAYLKVGCLVVGMAAGANSIDDVDPLWHGAMDALFGGVHAPSTLGSHLRFYAWGNVLQLERAVRDKNKKAAPGQVFPPDAARNLSINAKSRR
jgi:hypothetical protein